jgi:hypothetical protein
METKDGDPIHENILLGVEDLPLPCEDIDELSNLGRKMRARPNDGRSVSLTIGNGAGLCVFEDIIELGRCHRQQLWDRMCHFGMSTDVNYFDFGAEKGKEVDAVSILLSGQINLYLTLRKARVPFSQLTLRLSMRWHMKLQMSMRAEMHNMQSSPNITTITASA